MDEFRAMATATPPAVWACPCGTRNGFPARTAQCLSIISWRLIVEIAWVCMDLVDINTHLLTPVPVLVVPAGGHSHNATSLPGCRRVGMFETPSGANLDPGTPSSSGEEKRAEST
ncbi:hypothetical protein TESG_04161 [Trichophyton tonsurans CBS 112818]|uniref:Uncharacterized protein n=1 Tax=Trichophyton tonsurans (strain CBS 112818) TaxID=647933 RepID=F2RZI0_TRIT1|nr:hypothetical protein TESG_04161 [Trichophyton tonsurans CBS 112818]